MKERNLTQGPIFSCLIRFSLPMIAGNLLQQAYNLVDTLLVGRYLGPDALAAVGSSYTLMVFITSILIGLCMGSGAFFSADYGAGETGQLRQDIRLSFWFLLGVTALLYLIVYPCMRPILRLLQIPGELMEVTEQYVYAVFTGLVFVFLYNYYAYLLRALGNTGVPLVFLALSAVTNIGLDIWFIAGLKMGVRGAAWATVIAQGMSGIGIAVYALCKLPLLRQGPRRAESDGKRLLELMVGDTATGIQQSVMNFGILMIQGLVNRFGPSVMAAFAAAVKIDTLAYMPAQEFGNAYSLFVSQNYGAGTHERIRRGTRLAMGTCVGFCCLVSVAVFFGAEWLMQLFIDRGETEILAQGATYLRIEGSMYAAIGILFLWYGYFRGYGRPHISLILTAVSLGTRVLLAYALAPNTPLGVRAIWYAIPIGWLLADLAGWIFCRHLKIPAVSPADAPQ